MVHYNENEAENEKQIALIQNKTPRPRHGHKNTKYKINNLARTEAQFMKK